MSGFEVCWGAAWGSPAGWRLPPPGARCWLGWSPACWGTWESPGSPRCWRCTWVSSVCTGRVGWRWRPVLPTPPVGGLPGEGPAPNHQHLLWRKKRAHLIDMTFTYRYDPGSESVTDLAVFQNWECTTRREPYWVWLVNNWWMVEDSRSMIPVSEDHFQMISLI